MWSPRERHPLAVAAGRGDLPDDSWGISVGAVVLQRYRRAPRSRMPRFISTRFACFGWRPARPSIIQLDILRQV